MQKICDFPFSFSLGMFTCSRFIAKNVCERLNVVRENSVHMPEHPCINCIKSMYCSVRLSGSILSIL